VKNLAIARNACYRGPCNISWANKANLFPYSFPKFY